MNADFEVELAHDARATDARPYRRTESFAALNRRLSAHMLRLAARGDALLVEGPRPESLSAEARRRGVELISKGEGGARPGALFTPWGWTRSAVEAGDGAGADVPAVALEVVARINSKLWSHALEVEMGWAIEGACVARTSEELAEAAARACPGAGDKWVVKSP